MLKRKKPEKKIQDQIEQYARLKGLVVFTVDSKGVFVPGAKRFVASKTTKGVSDLIMCNNWGQFIAVEVKAKGRRSTVKPEQFDFLESIIERDGIAIVSDSLDSFVDTYNLSMSFKLSNNHDGLKAFLRKCLPARPKSKI